MGEKILGRRNSKWKGHELLVRERQERLVGKSGQGRAEVSLAWLKSLELISSVKRSHWRNFDQKSDVTLLTDWPKCSFFFFCKIFLFFFFSSGTYGDFI